MKDLRTVICIVQVFRLMLRLTIDSFGGVIESDSFTESVRISFGPVGRTIQVPPTAKTNVDVAGRRDYRVAVDVLSYWERIAQRNAIGFVLAVRTVRSSVAQ